MNPNIKEYDISNVVGIIMASFGAGSYSIGAGFIVAGLMIVAINMYNMKLIKGK